MALTSEPISPPSTDAPAELHCEHCGAPLSPDGEWCVECGAARTLIHRPPDWRIPVLVIAGVIVLVAAAVAITLVKLSDESTTRSAAPQPVAAPARSAVGSAPTSVVRRPAPLAGWPVGLSGWTVALATSPDKATAHATAVGAKALGLHVGLLFSSQHPAMPPGQWVVFSGRYPTRTAARTGVEAMWAKGYPAARVKLVGSTGG